MTDPVSVAASAATLAGICAKIGKYIWNLIGEIGPDGVISVLRIDVDSLSEELRLVNQKCQESAHQSSEFRIEPHVLVNIKNVQENCENTLKRLEAILDRICGFDANAIGRVKAMVIQTLHSDEVLQLQNRMTKYQQSLHFYMTLING